MPQETGVEVSVVSDLQLGILKMLADDVDAADMCSEMELSEHALNVCIGELKAALNARTVGGLVAKAIRNGLIA